jgi:hypothetical protein
MVRRIGQLRASGARRNSARSGPRRGRLARRLNVESLEPRHLLAAADLEITEFMASNSGALLDGDGNSSDWIEVRNDGSTSVDLADYFLTDTADDLTRWAFPSRMIAPGEHYVVFASSPSDGMGGTLDNYVDAGGNLHTSFSLEAGGEYVALTYEDPVTHAVTIVHEFAPQFPPQRNDISFGLGQVVSQVNLISPTAAAKTLVPASSDLDGIWNLPSYVPDANWIDGTTGVGFGQTFNGFAVRTFRANIGAGSPIGNTVDNIEEALEVVGNPLAQSSVAAGNFNVVNFVNNTTTGGNYGSGNNFFPGLTGADANHFVTEAHAIVTIPAPGNWTFGVASNEGFLLIVGDFEMERFGTGNTDQLATFNFTAPGEYELHLYNFERTGSTWLELFTAPGTFTSWNAASFDLIGDVANGGLAVRSDFVGSSGASISQILGTDVRDQMLGVSPSLYTRVEFNADNPAAYDQLKLRMKYDDAFVAYLNGQEVARRNFIGTPAWDSVADSPRTGNEVVTYEDIDISTYLPALLSGRNVLAIHGLNISATDGDALILPELIANDVVAEGQAYFTTPTPRAANGNGLAGFVEDTEFSVDRGFFDAPIQVAITTATPAAQIYYTTNGEIPTQATGTLYTGPININRTTTLRAAAFRSGYLPTNVDTQSYVFLADVVQQTHQTALAAGFPVTWGTFSGVDYGLDPDIVNNPLYATTIQNDLLSLPTMSIVMDIDDMFGSNGIYSNPTLRGVAWERATSVEWITTDGSPDFQVDAGIRIQGGYFRSNSATRKHSFRLLFKDIYGPGKLDWPLFGDGAADQFNTLVLRAGANDGYSWNEARYTEQYTRDEFGRSLQRAAGHPAAHGDFVHLYINGHYWGLYNLSERPDHEFAASYFGGDPDNWDAVHVGGQPFEAVNGDRTAWDAMLAKAAQGGSSLAAYMELKGKNLDGTRNPSIAPLLDVDSYIDYLAVNVWGGNWDWPWKNWWAARDRDPATTTGFQFFTWDYENTMGNNRNRSPLTALTLDQDFTGSDNAGQPHTYLQTNPEYRMAFADHVHKLMFNDGILTPGKLIERYQALADRIDRAMVGESARWGDMHFTTQPLTQIDWLAERDWILNTYLPQRSAIVLQELKSYNLYPNVAAPTFSQHGGLVSPGFDLSMVAPNGAIWYTLDGSDPRAPGGAISPSAVVFTGTPVDIPVGMTVKARALSGGVWSALNEAAFVTASPADHANLRVTELHYHPANHPSVPDDEDLEFIEFLNIGNGPISLAGVQITEFASTPYVFASDLVLAAGERIVVARNPAAFASVYGSSVNVAPSGYSPANFSNGGERIRVISAGGQTIVDFTYGDASPWPAAADGSGPSLEIVSPVASANDPANWRSSFYVGGTPGTSPVSLAGDYDRNQVVDAADQSHWRASFGMTVERGTGADGNGDGIIDAADYALWRKNLGATLSALMPTMAEAGDAQVYPTADSIADAHDQALPIFLTSTSPMRISSRSFAQMPRRAFWTNELAGQTQLLLNVVSARSVGFEFACERALSRTSDRHAVVALRAEGHTDLNDCALDEAFAALNV